MATRPWVTPQDVRDYTEYPEVGNRSDSRLEVDISRAEMYVINYTRNDFSDPVKYPIIPDGVRTAVILIAEMYAFNAVTGKGGGLKSETFDDYSYTLSDTTAKLDNLVLSSLLDPYILDETGAGINVSMRMWKL